MDGDDAGQERYLLISSRSLPKKPLQKVRIIKSKRNCKMIRAKPRYTPSDKYLCVCRERGIGLLPSVFGSTMFLRNYIRKLGCKLSINRKFIKLLRKRKLLIKEIFYELIWKGLLFGPVLFLSLIMMTLINEF